MKQEIADKFRYIYLERKQWQRRKKQLELLNLGYFGWLTQKYLLNPKIELYLLHQLSGTDVLKSQDDTSADPLAA